MPKRDRLPNRRGGSPSPAPPRSEAHRPTATACCALPAERRTPAHVVISELITNTVVHSGSPDITLRLAHEHSQLRIEVVDSGRWQRPTARPTPDSSTAESGRGLWIVETLTQHCGMHHTPHGTTAWALLPIT
jgi:anti-sigma regulatory factor (Ser/Thr protein kinase)